MVSELGIGGSIIKQENKMLLLDNAYVIKVIDNGTTVKNVSKFTAFAEDFAKNTKSNVQRELLEGQLTEEFMRESEIIMSIAALLCRVNADVHRLQLLNLHSFPDTVGEMLYAEKGMTITPRGDAYMVRQCKKVAAYHVLWNQRINNTCYQLFPVRLPNNQTKFLELGTRRLIEKSVKIKRVSRYSTTYIRDHNKNSGSTSWKRRDFTGFILRTTTFTKKWLFQN